MNKLTLAIAITIALTFSSAHAVSYIFNNTTQHMTVLFAGIADKDALCAEALLTRPDAQQIEISSLDAAGNIVYTLCD